MGFTCTLRWACLSRKTGQLQQLMLARPVNPREPEILLLLMSSIASVLVHGLYILDSGGFRR